MFYERIHWMYTQCFSLGIFECIRVDIYVDACICLQAGCISIVSESKQTLDMLDEPDMQDTAGEAGTNS